MRFSAGSGSPAGSSPEVLVRRTDGTVEVRPIAGTRPRGRNTDEDVQLEQELRSDEKERAEHVMLVDLGRNDLSRVCVPGTVHVERFMTAERYSHVTHLVSEVVGELRDGCTPFELYRALRRVNPSPYLFLLELDEIALVGSSPETVVKCEGTRAALNPIAGTIAPGAGDAEALLSSEKDRAEHDECLAKLRALETAIELAEASEG